MRTSLLWVIVGVLETVAGADDHVPDVRSKSAIVIDARSGTEIFAKAADQVRPIASTTKIFVAMAVREKGLDLDGWTEIRKADARQSAGGARTRLDLGERFRNKDLLRAMLISSDNRAPTALGRAAGMDPDELVAAMNKVAKRLGLAHTRFTDPTGLHGNVSTARELAIALAAALDDDVLREIMGDDSAVVVAKGGRTRIEYGTTNQPLVAGRFDVIGGKTGFTTPAGYCFVVAARLDGKERVLAFLGADGKQTRFADFDRVAAWIERGGATAAPPPAPPAKAKPSSARRRAKSKRAR